MEYLFLDAVCESLRRQAGGKGRILCAWPVCANGRKVLLHLALGKKESYQKWLEFLRHLVKRGLETPVLVNADGAPGPIRALAEVFPHSLQRRRLAHKTRSFTAKVPNSAGA